MRKFLTTGVAAVFAALSIAATAVPASAGGISFGFGGGDWDDDYDYGGVVVEFEVDTDEYDGGYSSWDRHVEYCEDQYDTYDEDTNLYYYAPGKQKHCNSPFD